MPVTLKTLIQGTMIAALMLTTLPRAYAQSSGEHLYRAELVLFERLESRNGIVEQMASRAPLKVPADHRQLMVRSAAGGARSDLDLLPPGQMHLNAAANRLERSGRYKVLMKSAWIQDFPPGYEGKPMRVSLGNSVPGAPELREFEGTIQIDRRRYLHVITKINHLGPAPAQANASEQSSGTGAQLRRQQKAMIEPEQPEKAAALITWLNETRRMRSRKLHYLDSPTLGLLVYFKPIE